MPDREPELVQLPEDLLDRSSDGAVHDDLAVLLPAVEVDVRHGHDPKIGERHGAAGMPLAVLEVGAELLRKRPDRRVGLAQRKEGEREGKQAQHRPRLGCPSAHATVKRRQRDRDLPRGCRRPGARARPRPARTERRRRPPISRSPTSSSRETAVPSPTPRKCPIARAGGRPCPPRRRRSPAASHAEALPAPPMSTRDRSARRPGHLLPSCSRRRCPRRASGRLDAAPPADRGHPTAQRLMTRNERPSA